MKKENYLFEAKDAKVLYKEKDVYYFSTKQGEFAYTQNAESVHSKEGDLILTCEAKYDINSAIECFDLQIKGFKNWNSVYWNNHPTIYFTLDGPARYKVVQRTDEKIEYLGELTVKEMYDLRGEKLLEQRKYDPYFEFQIYEMLYPAKDKKINVDFIEKAPIDENRNYYIYTKEIDFELLEKSGYKLLHRPYFAMVQYGGCCHGKYTINPYTQVGVDAAPFRAIPIHWSEFVEKFGRK